MPLISAVYLLACGADKRRIRKGTGTTGTPIHFPFFRIEPSEFSHSKVRSDGEDARARRGRRGGLDTLQHRAHTWPVLVISCKKRWFSSTSLVSSANRFCPRVREMRSLDHTARCDCSRLWRRKKHQDGDRQQRAQRRTRGEEYSMHRRAHTCSIAGREEGSAGSARALLSRGQ